MSPALQGWVDMAAPAQILQWRSPMKLMSLISCLWGAACRAPYLGKHILTRRRGVWLGLHGAKLAAIQIGIRAVELQQLIMGAALHNLAVHDHHH